MNASVLDIQKSAHACLNDQTIPLDEFVDILVAAAERDGELLCELKDENTIALIWPGRNETCLATDKARAKMRMICAAVFGLCKEKGKSEFDLSPYGCPQCRIPAPADKATELVVTYANTPRDHFVRIRVAV